MKWIILDFGTKRIKALKADLDGHRLQIEEFHSFDAKPDYFKGLGFPEPTAWAAATIVLNELDWLKADEEYVIVSALPSAYLETRYLKFPFKSEKQIEKVLNFELESTIPFDIEEIQIRSQILDGEGVTPLKKEALVLAMAFKRSSIKLLEGELKKFQISNPPITAQILALSTLKQAIIEPFVFGILEMGHSKSEFILMSKVGPILGLKTFWWGGLQLIQALQEELQIDAEKAEHILKHMDPEKPLSKPLAAVVRVFVNELRQSLKGMLSAGIALPKPLVIYSYGGPAKNKSLISQIEEILKVEFDVQLVPFPMPNLRSRHLVGLEKIQNLDQALPSLSIALAQTRAHRGKVASFSETGFQFQQNLKKLKTGSFTILKRIAMLLIFPMIYAFLQIGIQTKENKALLTTLPQVLKGSGFEWTQSETTDELVSRMKKELASNRNKISQLREDEKSPLIFLTQISKILPGHLKIDVKELRISPTTIFISAETNTNETASKLIEAMKASFPQLKAGAPTNCVGAQKSDCKSFTVEFEREKGV